MKKLKEILSVKKASTGQRVMTMTTEEAGRRGGLAVKKKYGPTFYSEIGRKGGQSTKRNYGPDFYSKIGEKGGEVVKDKHGVVFYSEIGRLGGKSRAKKQMKFEF
ncbi:MAG: general stress protein [Candidatus Woykebacteria bacterium]